MNKVNTRRDYEIYKKLIITKKLTKTNYKVAQAHAELAQQGVTLSGVGWKNALIVGAVHEFPSS